MIRPCGRDMWGCSSAGRAFDWQSKGRGFESPQLHQSDLKITLPGIEPQVPSPSGRGLGSRRPALACPAPRRGEQGMRGPAGTEKPLPLHSRLDLESGFLSFVIRQTLYGQQAGDYAGCGEHFQLVNLTVDHIIAQSKGGNDHIDNLQLLCGHCNSVKGDRGMEYLRTKLQLRTA